VKSKVHPKYKTKYHVGNWPEYERALRQRGNMPSGSPLTQWMAGEPPVGGPVPRQERRHGDIPHGSTKGVRRHGRRRSILEPAMPPAGQKPSDEAFTNIVAYILQQNGMDAGNTPLVATTDGTIGTTPGDAARSTR